MAGDTLHVVVPTWRWDTATETDIAEEVGRMFGYENIPRTVPKGDDPGGLSQYQKDRRLVREVLLGAGCDETLPMPFLAPGDLAKAGLPEDGVTLTNPLHAEESVLRTSLLPGQLKAMPTTSRIATPMCGSSRSTTCSSPLRRGDPSDEREHLAVAIAGEEAPAAVAVLDALDRALALPNVQLSPSSPAGLHPTRSADVVIAGRTRGHVGEVDPAVLEAYGVEGRVAWLELDLGAVLDGPHGNRSYTPVSKFPSSISTLRSSSVTMSLRAESRRAFARAVAPSSPMSNCSTSTEVRESTTAPGRWPTGCASRPPTAPSPTAMWPMSGRPASTRS